MQIGSIKNPVIHRAIEKKWGALYRLASIMRDPEYASKLTENHWDEVLSLARHQAITPFLHCWLASSTLPFFVRASLKADYISNVVESLKRERLLEKILRAFSEAAIPIVLLKGTALVQGVYSDPACRTMCDSDLWVLPDQIEHAKKILASMGYEEYTIPERPEPLQAAFGGESLWIDTASGSQMLVELHRQPFLNEWQRHVLRLNQHLLWQRALPIQGISARQLTPEDTILHICWHIAVAHQMYPNGLRALLDLDRLCCSVTINWEKVIGRAEAWRLKKTVWLVFSILTELLGNTDGMIPLSKLEPPTIGRSFLRTFALNQLSCETPLHRAGGMRFMYLLFLIDYPEDVLRLIWASVFPEYRWIVTRYNLHHASPCRVIAQRFWHPIRAMLKRNF